MRLSDKHIKELRENLDKGFLMTSRHPTLPLTVFKYSKGYEVSIFKMENTTGRTPDNWSELMKMCRGLVLDDDYNIISKPFNKFFNIEDYKYDYPKDAPFVVFEKIDGSCLEVFLYKGEIITCTLGSFVSDMADYAQFLLAHKYNDYIGQFKEGFTYIFEIIYPGNRVVLNYEGREELIFLAQFNLETCKEVYNATLEGFPYAKKFEFNSIDEILETKKRKEFNNEEGYVVLFPELDFRLKIKFEEYFKIHRIVSGLTEWKVWEGLKNNTLQELLIDNLPDEFIAEFELIKNNLIEKYNEIHAVSKNIFVQLDNLKTRKDFAIEVMGNYKFYFPILFKMFDGREYSNEIWQKIEPK